MPQLTIVKVLFCGQGMTALVECYDDGVAKERADALVLVDCGGEISWSDGVLDYVSKKILATATKGKNPVLDAMVISHQDGDHVQLLPRLATKLKGSKTTLGTIFVGGLGWSSDSQGYVNTFLATVPCEELPEFDADFFSHYVGAKTWDDLGSVFSHGETHVRIMISGLELTGVKPDIYKNGSSAVVAIDNGQWCIVLPGDATYQTMEKVNEIRQVGTLLPPVIGLELPHHGAIRTAVEDYNAQRDPSEYNWDIIDEFSHLLAPRQIVASAGPWNIHKHPIEEVFQTFDDRLRTAAKHSYLAFVFSPTDDALHEGWHTFDDIDVAEWATIYAIGGTVTSKASGLVKAKKYTRAGVYKGDFIYGNVTFTLDKTLRPEEMVSFEPIGVILGGPSPEQVVYAPAP